MKIISVESMTGFCFVLSFDEFPVMVFINRTQTRALLYPQPQPFPVFSRAAIDRFEMVFNAPFCYSQLCIIPSCTESRLPRKHYTVGRRICNAWLSQRSSQKTSALACLITPSRGSQLPVKDCESPVTLLRFHG